MFAKTKRIKAMYSHDVLSKAAESTKNNGLESINSPSGVTDVVSRVAASQQLFNRIWNAFITILREDALSDGDAVVVTEADLSEIYVSFQSGPSVRT
jgi:hypothetical protein